MVFNRKISKIFKKLTVAKAVGYHSESDSEMQSKLLNQFLSKEVSETKKSIDEVRTESNSMAETRNIALSNKRRSGVRY